MDRLINSLNQLDLSTITAADLKWLYGTFRYHSTGSGRDKQYFNRHGIQTPIGDMEESVWQAAAEHIIRRDGLEQEVAQIIPYITFKHSSRTLQQYHHLRALDAVLSRTFENPAWLSFIDYNQAYHPALLEQVHLVEVVTDCCQAHCTFTEQQLALPNRDHIHCPDCRKYTTYHRLDGKPVKGADDHAQC